MRNLNIKLTILGTIVVVGVIFFLQNASPVIPLVILGSKTIALPVALWLILAVVVGFLSSILLQFLLGLYSSGKKRPQEWDEEEEAFDFSETQTDRSERFQDYNRSNSENSPQNEPRETFSDVDEEDWESPPKRDSWTDPDDDWNIEEPPPVETQFRTETTNDRVYEVRKAPEKTTTEGSVYSYRYREATTDDNFEEESSSPKIYDANYRVIRPPLWNLSKEENEEDEDKQD